MKTKYISILFAAAALGFTACSDDEVLNEQETPTIPDTEVSEFKELGSFNFETLLGKSNSNAQSRTPGDVDAEHRPDSKYYLDHIYMLGLHPQEDSQPTPEDKGYNTDVKYDKSKFKQVKHALFNGLYYNLYYKVTRTKDNSNDGYSNSGYVEISTTKSGTDALKYDLSVFNLTDLQNPKTDRIPLNGFSYEAQAKGIVVRGSTLRYASYDPQDLTVLQYGKINDKQPGEGSVELDGNYAYLPKALGLDNMKGDGPQANLVDECQDRFFVGNNFLLAADNDQIYLLEVIPAESDFGGYFRRRTYPTSEGQASPDMLALNRLTTVINASFMLVDDETKKTASYFDGNSKERTLSNFKNTYGVDLSDLECPYAAVDGVNTRFYLNLTQKDNVTDPGRLVLWAKGHTLTGVDGKPYTKAGEASMDVFYDHSKTTDEAHANITRGYGIAGNSYSVAFKGSQEDTANQGVVFWVTVDGARIKIQVSMAGGVEFGQNIAHHLIVFVPAKEFAEAVKTAKKTKSSRGSANDFVELNLSSDCLQVR